MIFLDTSGVYALADKDDRYHDMAVELISKALQREEPIVIHNYIIVESAALLQRRLGRTVAIAFLEECLNFDIFWVDSAIHEDAVECLRTSDSAKISLVDALSFVFMKNNGVHSYIGFDKHFDQAGFALYD